jgi:hypothetical protein
VGNNSFTSWKEDYIPLQVESGSDECEDLFEISGREII